jgi:hypothetical protein
VPGLDDIQSLIRNAHPCLVQPKRLAPGKLGTLSEFDRTARVAEDSRATDFVALYAMPTGFEPVFSALKQVLAKFAKRLAVKTDAPAEYTLVTKSPSPFPQHKGQPMFFASVRQGKAYVSYHLMPLYMDRAFTESVSPALKKRMQGKTCFNFKKVFPRPNCSPS